MTKVYIRPVARSLVTQRKAETRGYMATQFAQLYNLHTKRSRKGLLPALGTKCQFSRARTEITETTSDSQLLRKGSLFRKLFIKISLKTRANTELGLPQNVRFFQLASVF